MDHKTVSVADDLLDTETTAREIGVSVPTIRRWEALKIGPPRIKIGRMVRYRRSSLRDWLLANERGKAA
jgi:predicted DNA-binding transcriptional regulator AlpA